MSNTDDPAMLAALRAHKHRHRVPHVCRPDAALTPLEQWDAKARSIALWASAAQARRRHMPRKTLFDYGLLE